jgi:CRP/FNR family transcriptional regulator, cyclic AMP receptor protein
MDVRAAMKRSELFRGLNDEQLAQLAGISHEHIYQTDNVIFHEGDEGDGLYIVGSGQVSVQQIDSEGVRRPAVYLGEGQAFGEMALIDAAKRSASIVAAVDNTLIYHIKTHDFTRLCQENTAIGYFMMRNIAQDLSFKLRHTASH